MTASAGAAEGLLLTDHVERSCARLVSSGSCGVAAPFRSAAQRGKNKRYIERSAHPAIIAHLQVQLRALRRLGLLPADRKGCRERRLVEAASQRLGVPHARTPRDGAGGVARLQESALPPMPRAKHSSSATQQSRDDAGASARVYAIVRDGYGLGYGPVTNKRVTAGLVEFLP